MDFKDFLIICTCVTLPIFISGCTTPDSEHDAKAFGGLVAEDLKFPWPDSAKYASLASSADKRFLYASWLRVGQQTSLELARYAPELGTWDLLPQASRDTSLFVNWADYPQVSVDNQGTVYIQYMLVADSEQDYAYHIWQRSLAPNSLAWSEPVRLHQDGSTTEHGFVSSVGMEQGIASVWLDGRNYAPKPGQAEAAPSAAHDMHGGSGSAMTMRYRQTTKDNQLGEPVEVDARTCDCCNTALAPLPNGGLFAAYRNRSATEVRDIYYTRFVAGQWLEPLPIAQDNWELYGCPVNGPSVASINTQVAVAWFTGATPGRVQLRLSSNGGESWGKVLVADSLNPIGKVKTNWVNDKTGLLSWVTAEGKLLVRPFTKEGFSQPPKEIADSLSDRNTGFPQLASINNTAYICWTKPNGGIILKKLSLN